MYDIYQTKTRIFFKNIFAFKPFHKIGLQENVRKFRKFLE